MIIQVKYFIPCFLIFFSAGCFVQAQKAVNTKLKTGDCKTTQNTLSKFQDKDTISINFHSQGCFYSRSEKIIIVKDADTFTAKLCKVSRPFPMAELKTTTQYKEDSVLKTVILTDQNIQDFIKFENELNCLESRGCTTIDWYDIRSKYLNVSRIDGSCRWGGFNSLRNSFFGN